MAYNYKAGTLAATEALKADGGCLSVTVSAFVGDSSFRLNDGDEINVRDGKQILLNNTQQLDVALVYCVSGKIDVLIQYGT